MPTYEYECKTCGTVFDLFQSITAAPLKKAVCEHCGKERPVRRLIGTGGGVIFKGSGFYQTDYRSEGYKKAESADKPGDKSGSESSKSTEKSTPAEKTATEAKSTEPAAKSTDAATTTAKSDSPKPVAAKSKRGAKKRD